MYNEYNQYYLAHHGIVGMKWGKRNGPPYPLNASTHNRVVKRGKKVGSGEDLRYKLTKAALKYGPALQGNFNPAHPVFKDILAPAIAERAKNSLQKRSLNRNKNLKKMDNDIDDNDGNIKSKGQMLKDAEFTSKTVGSKNLGKKVVEYFEEPYYKALNGKTYSREDLLTSYQLLPKLGDEFDKVYEKIDKKVNEAYYKPRFKTKGGNKVSIEEATNARMLLNMISNKLSSKAKDTKEVIDYWTNNIRRNKEDRDYDKYLKKTRDKTVGKIPNVSKKSVGKMPKGALKALAVLNPAMARSLPDAIEAAKTYKSSFGAMKEASKKNTKNGSVDMTDDNFWNWYEDYFTAFNENMRKNGLY